LTSTHEIWYSRAHVKLEGSQGYSLEGSQGYSLEGSQGYSRAHVKLEGSQGYSRAHVKLEGSQGYSRAHVKLEGSQARPHLEHGHLPNPVGKRVLRALEANAEEARRLRLGCAAEEAGGEQCCGVVPVNCLGGSGG
jgi:hypothetical protein